MELVDRFRTAVSQNYLERPAGAELVPLVLSQACVQVLPVAGAGLSLTDQLRIPLGASDDVVVRAERLQTTLGEGPCLTASSWRQPLAADLKTILARWPVFHRELVRQTPFRSIISMPLFSRHSHLRSGALDLYLTIPEAVPDFFLRRVAAHIAIPIAQILFDGTRSASGPGLSLPPWFNTTSVATRMHVWVAVGILIEHASLSNADALAALRAYAFGHDITLDDLADDLMARRVRPEALLA